MPTAMLPPLVASRAARSVGIAVLLALTGAHAAPGVQAVQPVLSVQASQQPPPGTTPDVSGVSPSADAAVETPEDTLDGKGQAGPPPPRKPPDGLLPVVELTRLSYTARDNPKALLYGKHLLVVGSSGFVEGHDAATGSFEWKLGLPGEELFDPVVFEAGPLVLGETDAFTVVLSEPSGHILLVDGLTGNIRSETRLPFPLGLPPIRGPGDIVFLATPSGDVVAYDVDTQLVVFQTATGEAPLAIASTASLVIVSGASQNVTAIELPQGRVRWTFRGRAAFHAAAAFDRDAKRVYIGDDTGEFYCLDAVTGAVKFRWSTGAAIRNTALVEAERIYLASYANSLFAFNAISGDEHWRANLPGRPATSPMRVRNRLLVATFDGVLIEIDPQRGQPGKRYTAPGEIVVPPSFFLASPTPEELNQQLEESEPGGEPGDEDEVIESESVYGPTRENADDADGLDPEIFGPPELGTSDETSGETDASESTDDTGATVDGEVPVDAEPVPPAWFERSRIAMALRSGEVLLLGHKAPAPTPSRRDTANGEDDEESGSDLDPGEDRPGLPRPPGGSGDVPF